MRNNYNHNIHTHTHTHTPLFFTLYPPTTSYMRDMRFQAPYAFPHWYWNIKHPITAYRPVKLDEKRAFWRKKCNKAAVCFKTFIITYLISYQFCTPLSALLTPPSWKDGGQKQFFVNTFLNTYFRGKRVYINVILKTIFYKICSTYFFVWCSVLMLKVHKDFRNGVHENNHSIKTMQYTQKVYRTFYVENVI